MEKSTGKTPSQLVIEPPHEAVVYLWEWYCKARRSVALTYNELESWSRLTRTPLTARDVEALMEIDSAVSKELSSE